MKKLTIIFILFSTTSFSQEVVVENEKDSVVCIPTEKVIPPMTVSFIIFYKFASIGFKPIREYFFKPEEIVTL